MEQGNEVNQPEALSVTRFDRLRGRRCQYGRLVAIDLLGRKKNKVDDDDDDEETGHHQRLTPFSSTAVF